MNDNKYVAGQRLYLRIMANSYWAVPEHKYLILPALRAVMVGKFECFVRLKYRKFIWMAVSFSELNKRKLANEMNMKAYQSAQFFLAADQMLVITVSSDLMEESLYCMEEEETVAYFIEGFGFRETAAFGLALLEI